MGMPRTALAASVAAAVLLAGVAASDVVKLTASNFDRRVVQSDEVWMVEFYAPWCGHCKALAPEWEKAATALRGVVNVAAVDATVEQALAGKYGVQGFPTIKVFGADKGSPADYQGQRTARAIADEGLKAARRLVRDRLAGGGGKRSDGGGSKRSGGSSGSGGSGGSDVVTLTASNFKELVLQGDEAWMVEFYAPWCGHCKALAPEWEQAATQLRGKVKVGAVDATVHTDLAQQFGVKGFPTIKAFAPGAGKAASSAVDYNGARTAGAIADFAMGLVDSVPVEVSQVDSQQAFDKLCPADSRLICVLAFLPHIQDSGEKGREQYLDTLVQLATKRRRDPFIFMWLQAGAQPAVEEALGLSYGFPAVVAVNRAKGRFAPHRGQFSGKKLSRFLSGLATGRGATLKLPQLPAFVKASAASKVEVVEEEFSLDDIMNEEL